EILGVLKGDGTFGDATNQSGLTIRGTSVLGYLVSVFVNDQLVGYAIPEASGRWTLDNSQQTYPDGLYRLTAQATNQAGSVSPIGAALTVQILTTAPVAPVITGLSPQSVNSLIATNRPTILGTSAPNVWIHISIDQGAGIGSFVTRANSLGKWSYQTTALAQGPASVSALAKDNAGNQSGVSNRINFIVDSVAPEISVTGLGPNAQFNKQTLPISFGGQIIEVGTGIQSVYTTVLGPNGLWYDGTGFVSSTPVWQPAQISGIAWNSLIQPSKMIQSLANPNGKYVLSVGGFDNIGNLRIVQSGVPDNMLALLESLRNIRNAEFGLGAIFPAITYSDTTFGYSDIRPTVTTFTILPGANNTQVGSLVFSTPVTGLTPSDFAVTGAVVTSLTGSGANYSFTLTRVGTGRLTVSVPEGVVADAFGNTNLASKSIARVATFDTFTVFGTPAGVAPIVTLKQAGGPTKVHLAFGSAFKGGVQAAIGDFNLDGIPDVVVAPGKGGGPNIRIIDGATGAIIRSFMAFDSKYMGGVNVATGDFDGDGIHDIIATTNGGIKAQLRVFSGRSDNAVLPQFNLNPYGGFIGSVAVSTGDFNRDGLADIITVAGATGDVRVWSGNNGALAYQFAAILPTSLVPLIVVVASADTNRNGVAEVLVGVKGSGGTTIQSWDLGLNTTRPTSNIQVTDQVFQSTFSLSPSVETLLGLRDVNGGQPYKSPADSLLSGWWQLR
ncbi:MAG: Ig-like domain-containing protein, partial [Planctomycetota bacterium]|nr:Ig-like domain-containing protein [Planctomycetota bacterium]